MPSHFEIDPTRRVVTVSLSGKLSDTDLVQLYERLRADKALEPDYGVLFDLLESDGSQLTAEGIRTIAQLPLVFSPESRRAILVCSDFGMARMYEMLRAQPDDSLSVFRDAEEARRWVEVRED